jgi:membrane-bound metal-dependent hydrolase YbcI (DUF457 family)
MMGRTHLTTGLTSGAWLATAGAVAGLPPALVVLAVPLAAWSALLPDLDHGRSTATLSVPPVTVPVSWVLRRFVDHRGPTHTPRAAPVFGAAVALPSWWIPGALGGWSALWWFLVVTLGCLTHVWGDARTLSGVPWRGPWRKVEVAGWKVASVSAGRLRIGRPFRTGSEYEEWRLHRVYLPAAVVSIGLGALVLRLVSR